MEIIGIFTWYDIMSSLNVSYYNISINNFADMLGYNGIFPYAWDFTLLILFGIVFITSKKITFSLFITSIASYILFALNMITSTETGTIFSLTLMSFLIDLYYSHKEENYGLVKIG